MTSLAARFERQPDEFGCALVATSLITARELAIGDAY